jgi:hypothetical protein
MVKIYKGTVLDGRKPYEKEKPGETTNPGLTMFHKKTIHGKMIKQISSVLWCTPRGNILPSFTR